MPPTIVLVRHAQALHNVANKSPPISPNTSEAVRLTCFFPRSLQDHSLHDPSLSELGYSQLPALKKSLQERFGNVEPGDIAIITSPMRRCIQTALGSIDWLLEKGLKMTANADWQENSDKPCDTGSPVPSLAAEFPQVDFTPVLSTPYPDKTSAEAEAYYHTRSSIMARGRRGLSALYARPEKFILVFSHSGFLRCGCVGWWFHNSDYRVFTFLKDPADASVKDWSREAVVIEQGMEKGGLGWCWDERVSLGEGVPTEKEEETN